MRGAPHVGFSTTIRKINSRTSFEIRLLPAGLPNLEISLPYTRKPARCQRTIVSGVTTIKASFQADQNWRAMIQKSLSMRPIIGRGRRRFKTVSCCRRARFSKTSSVRLRKRRTRTPNPRAKRLNMSGSYSRSCSRTRMQVIDSAAAQNFGEGKVQKYQADKFLSPGYEARARRPKACLRRGRFGSASFHSASRIDSVCFALSRSPRAI
jgi:hypothetical protein